MSAGELAMSSAVCMRRPRSRTQQNALPQSRCRGALPRCRELACLAMTPSEAVMAGNVKFSAEGLDGGSSSSSSSDQASADSLPGSGGGAPAS